MAVYIRPQATTEEEIETKTTAIADTGKNVNTIIVGEINCRIDKKNTMREIVLETLANRREVPTYIAHNGTSAIELLLNKGKYLHLLTLKELWFSNISAIRKHMPIAIRLEKTKSRTRLKKGIPQNRISRRLKVEEVRENMKRGSKDENKRTTG